MARCSHQLKARIAQELERIALNPKDARRPAAEWELAICHFSGFGVPSDFTQSHHWLSLAHDHGVIAAQKYRKPLCDAMGIFGPDPGGLIAEKLEVTSPANPRLVSNQRGGPWDNIPEDPEPVQCLAEEEEGRSTVSADEGSERNLTSTQSQASLSPTAISIITRGSLDELKDILHNDPVMLGRRDGDGNTTPILAAKHKRYDVLCHLLDNEDVDFAAANKAGQTVLHHMTSFNKEELEEVLPKMMRKGANITQEALPSRNESDRLLFFLGIRCCPVLKAVLRNDMVLLKVLLEASHADGSNEGACRVCEAGSGFRRILAVSFSLFQANAIEILIGHLQNRRGRNNSVDLDRIEVWAGAELLPLHKVPFNSVAVAAMDLPECFFRALTLGKVYKDSLSKIIHFLLKTTRVSIEIRALSMLSAAVAGGSLDGVELVLEDAAMRGRPPLWWLEQTGKHMWVRVGIDRFHPKPSFHPSPLWASINLGHRKIFDRLLRDDRSFLRRNLEFKCTLINCRGPRRGVIKRVSRLLCGRSGGHVGEHTHERLLARSTLLTAVTARHQDSYFL